MVSGRNADDDHDSFEEDEGLDEMGDLTSEPKKAGTTHPERPKKKKTPTEHLIDYLEKKKSGRKSILKRKTNKSTN